VFLLPSILFSPRLIFDCSSAVIFIPSPLRKINGIIIPKRATIIPIIHFLLFVNPITSLRKLNFLTLIILKNYLSFQLSFFPLQQSLYLEDRFPYFFWDFINNEKEILENFAKENNLVIDGGTDFHNFEDGKNEIGDRGISEKEFLKLKAYHQKNARR